MNAPTTTTRRAPAKVNLCLRIVGRRPDGYHLLDSIFAAVDLWDLLTISVEPFDEPRITVACSYPDVPTDDTNLAARAAAAFLAATDVNADVQITIDKRIPPGAGLGGGSSDAATVLATLNDLLGVHLSHARLAELALSLGADVPFFLTGGCARVRGIGEAVEPITGWPGHDLLIALPSIGVSTAWAFRNYAADFTERPEEPRRLASSSVLRPALLRNDLETVVLPAFPQVAEVKRGLLAAGADAAVMSGSGAAVVAICPPAASPAVVRDTFAASHPSVRIHCGRILPADRPTIG